MVCSALLCAAPAEAEVIARALAPDGRGPGVRYNEYGASLGYPARYVTYQSRFERLDELVALLEVGEPGALELALEILLRLEPEACLPIARLLVPASPWTMLSKTLGHALGRSTSEESFRLLIDHPDLAYFRDGLKTNGYPGGVAEAWQVYRAVDVTAEDLDSARRAEVLPVLAYLLRHDHAPAFAELVRLLDAPHHVTVFVAHALSGFTEGRRVLAEHLAALPPGERLAFPHKLAIRVLLEDDTATVVDALGGKAFLGSLAGRPRLAALLDWLRDDTSRTKQGWLAADARFAELLGDLRGDADRSLSVLARELLQALPAELRPKVRRAAKKTAPVQLAPAPELLRELEAAHASLERLVKYLKMTRYRFAEPRRVLTAPRTVDLKALASLEKKVVVPSALAALWRIVGAVDLRGHDPSWPRSTYMAFPGASEPAWSTEPLVIAPAADVIREALDESNEPPIALRLAPDAIGKAGYSGGDVTIWLPQDGPDPTLDQETETLLTHLRRHLTWGGFPGFAAIDDRPEAWLASARAAVKG